MACAVVIGVLVVVLSWSHGEENSGFKFMGTVKPPDKGHLRGRLFAPYGEVGLSRRFFTSHFVPFSLAVVEYSESPCSEVYCTSLAGPVKVWVEYPALTQAVISSSAVLNPVRACEAEL